MSTLLRIDPHVSKFNNIHIHVALETLNRLVALGGCIGQPEERFIGRLLSRAGERAHSFDTHIMARTLAFASTLGVKAAPPAMHALLVRLEQIVRDCSEQDATDYARSALNFEP